MEPIEGSETSAIRTQTPGNYPKDNILQLRVSLLELIFMHSSQQQSLKSVYSTGQNFSATTATELLQINEKMYSCNISKHSAALMHCTPDGNK